MPETAGVMLLRAGLITQDQLAQAIASRRQHGGTLSHHLIRLGMIGEEQLADFYRHRLMVPRVAKEALAAVTKKVIAVVPSDMAAEFNVVPVSLDREGNLTLAMADPADTHAVDEVGFFSGHFVMRAVATESAIAWALEKYYGITAAAEPAAPAPTPPPAPPVEAAPEPIGDEITEPTTVPIERVESYILLTQAKAPPKEAVVLLTQAKAPPEEAVVLLTQPKAPPAIEMDTEPAGAAELAQGEPPALEMEAEEPPDVGGDAGVTLVDFQYSPSGRVETARTVDLAAESPAARSLAEAINALRAATDADTVACALLIYFSTFCERAVFFNVRKGSLRMHDCAGKDIDVIGLKELVLSVDEPSVFRDVMAGRFPYRGAPGDSAAVTALAGVLPPPGDDVVIVPIAVRHRVVSLIYGDRLAGELTEAGMTRVALEAGIAYERVIAARKEHSGKTTG